MINLANLQPNKVSTNLLQYPMIWMGDTGVGKTYSMLQFLKENSPEGKNPLFIELEDRFQNIPDIIAVRVKTVEDFLSVINQLRNPKIKEQFSCVVIDTLDKFEEMCEQYVNTTRNAEILKDVGGFGEGTQRYKASLRKINDLQTIGLPVSFIAQGMTAMDVNAKIEKTTMKLNKNTYSYCKEPAYLVGRVYTKKDERYITFKRTDALPDLKDSFGLPKEIKVSELTKVWNDTITNKHGDNVTKEVTIDKRETKLDFNKLMESVKAYGNLLYDNNHQNDAMAILKKHLGIDENGNVNSLTSLTESQVELLSVIVLEMKEVCTKFNLM